LASSNAHGGGGGGAAGGGSRGDGSMGGTVPHALDKRQSGEFAHSREHVAAHISFMPLSNVKPVGGSQKRSKTIPRVVKPIVTCSRKVAAVTPHTSTFVKSRLISGPFSCKIVSAPEQSGGTIGWMPSMALGVSTQSGGGGANGGDAGGVATLQHGKHSPKSLGTPFPVPVASLSRPQKVAWCAPQHLHMSMWHVPVDG